MLADNSHYLIEHARQRRQETLERARRTLAELAETGQSVTVAELAGKAGVSRSWIYTQPELRDQIQQQQRSHSDSRSARQTAIGASAESLHRRLTLAHERIGQLRTENQKLREELAHAHGQLRAVRIG
jgi:chromosome segregation ATPase